MHVQVPESQVARDKKRDDDLDDGAVEELLFGWFEGWIREGRKAKIFSLNSILSFPFFLFQSIIIISKYY
jgi:hypothetical protein